MQKLNLGFLAELYNPELTEKRLQLEFAKKVFGFSGVNQVTPIAKPVKVIGKPDINNYKPKKPVWQFVFENWKNGFTEKQTLDNPNNKFGLTLKAIHGEYIWLNRHFK